MGFEKFWWRLTEEERFAFIEANYPIRNPKGQLVPLQLEPWQKKWFREGPLFNDFTQQEILNKVPNRISWKHRGGGWTLICISLETLVGSLIYRGIFIPYVAGVEKQAGRIIDKVHQLRRDSKIRHHVMNENSKTTIEFYYVDKDADPAERTVVEAFAGGNPAGIVGPRALWGYFDEYAYARYQDEIMNAVTPFFSEGGQLSIVSVARGKNNRFWDILSNCEDRGFSKHVVLLFKGMEKWTLVNYKYVDENNNVIFDLDKSMMEQEHLKPLLMSPWLSWSNLEKERISAEGTEDFLMNYCGEPMDTIVSVFSEELLGECSSMNVKLTYEATKNQYWGGTDFAHSRDETANVFMWEELIGGKRHYYIQWYSTTQGKYPAQKDMVMNEIRNFKPVAHLCDSTGLGGMNWVDDLQNELPKGVIFGCTYNKKDYVLDGVTQDNGEAMVVVTKRVMQEGRVHIPGDAAKLIVQLKRFEKKILNDGGTRKYSGKRGGKHRDDLARAFLQAVLIAESKQVIDIDSDYEDEFGSGSSW